MRYKRTIHAKYGRSRSCGWEGRVTPSRGEFGGEAPSGPRAELLMTVWGRKPPKVEQLFCITDRLLAVLFCTWKI